MNEKISTSQAQKKFIADVRKGNCAFLVGAGISMIKPSYLPSGNKLKEILINNLIGANKLKKFLPYLIANPKYEQLVPEILFQDVYSIIGSKILEIYQILRLAVPNKIHQILAHIISSKNVKIFTTNFDLLIDRFLQKGGTINHLHGSLDNPSEMAVLINQVGLGVNNQNKSNFRNAVKNKSVFVFGYSGNDKDIIDLINQSECQCVYWMIKRTDSNWVLKNISQIRRNCFFFYSDLKIFFDFVNKRIKAPFKKFKMRFDETKKEKIYSEFQKKLSPFERMASLENIFFRIQEYELAYKVGEIGLRSISIKNKNEKFSFLIFLSDTVYAIGRDLEKCLSLINEGLNDKDINSHLFLKGQLLNQKGIYLLRTRGKRKAVDCFNEAFSIFEECLAGMTEDANKDKAIDYLGRVSNNIGYYYDRILRYDKAINFYKKALSYKSSRGDILGISSTLVNMALTYLRNDNYPKFYYRERRAMELINKYDFHYRHAYLFREKGLIFINKGHKKKALGNLEKALDLFQKFLPTATHDIELTLKAIESLSKNPVNV